MIPAEVFYKGGYVMDGCYSAEEIREMGFEWPKLPVIQEEQILRQGKVDLVATLETLESSHAFYRRQTSDAFNFKSRYAADYSDFTDRYDEYASKLHQYGRAITYIQGVIQAARE